MSEIPDVVGGEPIEIGWGNPIRDRTVQRYVDATERDTLVPVPVTGTLSYLTGSGSFEIYDGAAWIPYPRTDGATFTGVVRLENASLRFGTLGRGVTFENESGGFGSLSLYDTETLRIRLGSSGVTRFAIQGEGDATRFAVDAAVATFTVPVTFKTLAGFEQATIRSFSPDRVIQRVGFVDSPNSAYLQITGGNDPNVGPLHTGSIQFRAGADTPILSIEDNVDTGPQARIHDDAAPLDAGVIRNIFAGTTSPDAGLGGIGDVYLQVGAI